MLSLIVDLAISAPVVTALVCVLLPLVLYFMKVNKPHPKNAPPVFEFLVPALQGKFDLKLNGPNKLIRAGYDRHGEVFSMNVGHQPVTFFVGPEAQEAVFAANDSQLDQRPVYKFTVPVFGKGIAYDASPKDMSYQLRFLKHGLDKDAMLRHSAKIIDEVQDFFADWGDEGEIDLHHVLSDLVIKTASRALIGKEVRQHLHAEVAELYQTLSDGMTHITFAFPRLPTAGHRARDAARARIVEIFKGVLLKRREAQANGAAKEHDLLQLLMDSSYPDGRAVNDDEVCGLMLAALFAGQHTSSITSTWMGLELHGCPDSKDLLRRLRQEQRDVLKNGDGQLTYEALQKMNLMYSCVKETLRKYPPLIMLMRRIMKPFAYKNFVVPEGHIALISPPTAHSLDHVFHDADTFVGDRFLEEKWEDAQALKASWLPFGGGRHICLGRNFGILQVATLWSYIIRHFEFEMVQPIPNIDYSHLVAGPKVGTTQIRFRRIKFDWDLDESLPTDGKANFDNGLSAAKVKLEDEEKRPSAAAAAAPVDINTVYSAEEIAKHNTRDDCWVVIDGVVYDVSKFLDEHPGGSDRVVNIAGGDVSFEFDQQNHSKYARSLMKDWRIGVVAN